MKYPLIVLAALVVPLAIAVAQESGSTAGTKAEPKQETLHGYVVDAMCAGGFMKKPDMMEKAAGHTKSCALEESCAASGYGVFSNSKYYKFDANGDKLAKALLEKTKKEKGILVDVTGKQDGDHFAVASIKESMGGPKMKKGGAAAPKGHEQM